MKDEKFNRDKETKLGEEGAPSRPSLFSGAGPVCLSLRSLTPAGRGPVKDNPRVQDSAIRRGSRTCLCDGDKHQEEKGKKSNKVKKTPPPPPSLEYICIHAKVVDELIDDVYRC